MYLVNCHRNCSGQNPGILAKRPDNYVPFLSPVYDEANTELQTQAYRLLKMDDPDTYNQAPEPLYKWVYRPEMQFTSYDLKISEIQTGKDTDDSGVIEIDELINILDHESPVIQSDAIINILYDLGTTDLLPLDYFNAGDDKKLIFTVGEQEITATIGEDEKLIFDDLAHLDLLSPDDYLTIKLYANNDVGNTLWEWAFGTIGLFTDMNRDGHILKKATDKIHFVDTRNSEERPFHFWINDDDDEGEINEGKGAGGDIPGDDTPDYDNDAVDGMRDLVDFFPVYVDVKAALASFPPEAYTYRLKHAGGALKFLETDNLLPDSIDKQKRPDAPLKDAGIALSLADHAVTILDNNGTDLSTGFLRKIQQDQGGIILLEATEKTGEPLVLEIVDSGSQHIIASTKLHLSIDTVDKMYRHINLQDVARKNGENIEEGALTRTDVPENYPDEETTPDYLVFVHGYSVSGEAAKGWNAEMFKRFYQLGSTGRFIGVTWHGDTGLDYHHAVVNAFVTSMALNSRLVPATPSRSSLTIAGHSLGNMVVSNAIAEGGLQPTRYFMLNAAVPIEAYDSTQKVNGESIQMSRNMTEADWYEYPEELYSANWHQLFDESDARQAITWKDRFEEVLPYAYNFYSPGEDVVENANIDEEFQSSLWTTIFDHGRHAWVQQEIGKGCQNLIAGAVFSRCQAGWSFNLNQDDLEYVGEEDPFYDPDTFGNQYRRYQTGTDAITALDNGDLTNEELAQFGFFRRFNAGFENLYAPIQAGNELRTNGPTIADAQAIASQQQTQWELLAHGIPAQSFAAAANPMSVLDFSPFGGENRNFNMHLMRDLDASGQPQWPQGRITGEPEDYHWFHSDVRNMATPYVHQVYETMLDIGGLRSAAP